MSGDCFNHFYVLFSKKLAKHTGLFPGSTPTCSHSSVLNNYYEVPWLLHIAKSMGMKIEKGN